MGSQPCAEIHHLLEPLKHGIQNEAKALQQCVSYMKHSAGHPVKTLPSGFAVNSSFPFLGCSPDAKVIDQSESDPFGIVEIKCPYKNRTITPKTACNDTSFHLEMRN